MASRITRIRGVLQTSLSPSFMDIINESGNHNAPPGSETHLKIVVVSPEFNGLPLLKRHQKIQELLTEEMNTGLHALSIVAKTDTEWAKTQKVDPSPKCMGGFGK